MSLILPERKFMVLNACLRKEKRSQINELGFHLKKLEKDEQFKVKVQEIIKARVKSMI